MRDKQTKAQQVRSLRRIFGKFCQLVARKMPFLPGKVRVMFQAWHGVVFVDARSVFLGEDVYFDDLYPQDIQVGRRVLITSGTRILSHFLDTEHPPTPQEPFRFYRGQVIIGDYVFIGMNTVIAKPVTIGEGVIIGANSVVVDDIPDYAIVVGTPAKVVGKRPPLQRHP